MKVVLLPTRVLAVVVECVLIYDIEPVAFVNLNSVKELPLLFPIEVDVGATLLRNDTFPNNFVPAGCNRLSINFLYDDVNCFDFISY